MLHQAAVSNPTRFIIWKEKKMKSHFFGKKSVRVTTQNKQLSEQMYVVTLPLGKVLFFPLPFIHHSNLHTHPSLQLLPVHKVFCDMTFTKCFVTWLSPMHLMRLYNATSTFHSDQLSPLYRERILKKQRRSHSPNLTFALRGCSLSWIRVVWVILSSLL